MFFNIINHEKLFAMNPKDQLIERLRRNEGRFTTSDHKIADYLIHNYPQGLFETAMSVSKKLNLSVTTVTRFFPKIEFKNIRDAQELFRKQLEFLENSPLDRFHQQENKGGKGDNFFQQAWDQDIANIQKTFNGISQESVKDFITLLLSRQASTVYVIGERKMYALSYYYYIQLNAILPKVILLNTENSLIADTIISASANDILIVFDFRRYPSINLKLSNLFKKLGGTIVVIGDSPISPCTKLSDISFVVENQGTSIFDSYTAGFTLINSLMAVLIAQAPRESIRERYETLEQYYKHFEIFSSNQGSPQVSRLDTLSKRKDQSDD